MNAETSAIYSYLAPAWDSFWNWSDDGTVITWLNGRTLAFTEEIAALVTSLAQTSLPPLGAILLFRAACRDDWKQAIAEQGSLATFFVLQDRKSESDPTAVSPLGSSEALTTLASKAFERLDALATLPLEQRKGLPALCALADTFFQGCRHAVSQTLAEAVALEFAKGIVPDAFDNFREDDAFEECVASLGALVSCAGVPSSDSLALRKQTGLDSAPRPAEIPVPEAVRQLIGSLMGDPELAAMAKLAHDLLAAVSVPRTLRPADELPLGGFSDISNRGTLDRLLISELAHDDLTLAVRVATNEAMYMRRESPPAHPPERRALLIDAGIRMWGVPRVMATAVALAFAAAADPRVTIQAYRPSEDRLDPVTLSTRDGIVAHLAALEALPHPAAALPGFFKSLDNDDDARADAIIITHEAVLADHDFQRELFFQKDKQLLVATVARVGLEARMRIYQVTLAGRRLLSEASLSIEDLLHDRPAKRPLVTNDKSELPVILSLPELPLRIPFPLSLARAAAIPGQGVLMLTRTGRLLFYDKAHPDGHPVEVARDLSEGHVLGFYHEHDTVYIVVREPRTVAAHIFDFGARKTGVPLVFKERKKPPIAAGHYAGYLFLVYDDVVDAIHIHSGMPRSLTLSRETWISGRYFRKGTEILALAFEGSSIKFESVRHQPDVLHVLERPGHDGPLFVQTNGQIVRFESAGKLPEKCVRLVVPFDRRHTDFRVTAVSPDGSTLLATTNLGACKAALSPTGGSWTSVSPADAEMIEYGRPTRGTRHGPVRKNFVMAALTDDGEIVLMSAKGEAVRIRAFGAIRMMDNGPMPLPADLTPFQPWPEVSRSYDLKVARTPHANLFLDSRGMLHLVPRNRSLAQVTFALCNGQTAAWTSDGLLLGPDPFRTGPAKGSPDDIAQLLRKMGDTAP